MRTRRDVAVKATGHAGCPNQKVLIAESFKVWKHSKYILGKIEDFDYWITDKKPDPDLVETLRQVTILYDGKDSDIINIRLIISDIDGTLFS